jgi:hypothetical protein
MEQEKFDIKKVKVHRTPEGTIFETTALVILLSAWIVSIATQKLATTDEWFGLGVFSIVTIVSLLCAYSPSDINFFAFNCEISVRSNYRFAWCVFLLLDWL